MEAARKAAPEVETLCLTLAYTGARISEVLALTPASIDPGEQAIIIESLKKRARGIYRAVPVPHELIARLGEVHSSSNSDGNPRKRLWCWGRTKAWAAVKEIMSEAEIAPALSMPKALRHGFGVAGVADAGVPLNMMQKWLGHAKIETTAIYANAMGREERIIAKRMW